MEAGDRSDSLAEELRALIARDPAVVVEVSVVEIKGLLRPLVEQFNPGCSAGKFRFPSFAQLLRSGREKEKARVEKFEPAFPKENRIVRRHGIVFQTDPFEDFEFGEILGQIANLLQRGLLQSNQVRFVEADDARNLLPPAAPVVIEVVFAADVERHRSERLVKTDRLWLYLGCGDYLNHRGTGVSVHERGKHTQIGGTARSQEGDESRKKGCDAQ